MATNEELFINSLIGQVRALDQFGTWTNKGDTELLIEKYVRTKEQLREIPIIADIDEMQIKDIRLIFQAVAIAFERKNNIMCNVILEMSHEGFGRGAVMADKIVIWDKYLKDAHRYSFRTYEDLVKEGGKILANAFEIYEQYKPCK